MCRLLLNNVSKIYGESSKALDNVSFSVGSSEIVGLIGANGAGKTTAIKICTRLMQKFDGKVEFGGVDIETIPMRRYPISYIPDEPVFYEFMTLKENLTFISALYNNSGVFSISELIKILELTEHLDKMPYALSKGTKQKMMIAMALLRQYQVLIADEPFTGLDPYQINIFKKLLLDMRASGKSILVSTHLLEMVESFCDRYVILHRGKLLASGTFQELSAMINGECETIEDVFLGLTSKARQI